MNNKKNAPRIRKPKRNVEKDYVDKIKLYDSVKKYKEDCAVADSLGKQHPNMPSYIGEAAMLVSERLSYTYSYRGYPFRDEMVADGILFCIKGLRSFDCEKYNDVFTYFTMAVQFAFWQRIEKEKKYLYTKYKMTDRVSFDIQMQSMSESNGDVLLSDIAVEHMNQFIKDFETNMEKKKNKGSLEIGENSNSE